MSRYLKSSILASVLSAGILALIPADPKNARLLGYSTARLAMIGAFLLLASLLGAAFFWLRTKPAWERRLNAKLANLARPVWLREGIFLLASLAILAGLYQAAEYLTSTDAFVRSNLLRLFPVSFFMAWMAVETLRLEGWREEARRWAKIIGLSILGIAAGRLLQAVLLGVVERPTPTSTSTITASQVGLALGVFLWSTSLMRRPRRERLTWSLLLVLVGLLAGIQWSAYPAKYWRTQTLLALFTPLGIFTLALLTQAAFGLYTNVQEKVRGRLFTGMSIAAVIALLALAIPYYRADEIHSQTLNYSPIFTDQGEYLQFAKQAWLSGFRTTGDHNRMPLYPYLQGLFYRPGMSDQAFFEQGKQINIFLSLGLLALIFLVVQGPLGRLQAALLSGIVAFSLFIFKAPYFQAEILYYFLAFLGFVLALQLLENPALKLGIGAGIVFGLAHLTKASVLPGMMVFGAVFAVQELGRGLRQRRNRSRSETQPHVYQEEQVDTRGAGMKEGSQRGALEPGRDIGSLEPAGDRGWSKPGNNRHSLRRWASAGLVFLIFLAVIFPYIQAMKAQFGHYFYNVNTTFYVWYDDNFQAIQAEKEYHFADAYPSQMSADELPSLRNYLRTHSLEQILERIGFGLNAQVFNILSPFSVSNYQLSYLAILVVVFLADLKRNLRLVRLHPSQVGFSVLYFIVYLGAFVWYSPISPERRFTYGLYLPFLLAVFLALKAMARNQAWESGGRIDLRLLVNAANFVIFLSLVVNIYLVLTERMYFDRYGA